MQALGLSSTNTKLAIAPIGGDTFSTFGFIPLGTKDGTATGEIGVKVLSVGLATGASAGASVTPNFASLSNSAQIIPVGAKGWTATILTGTGVIGGVTVPAGFSIQDNNTLLSTITVTANAGSTAIVYWNT